MKNSVIHNVGRVLYSRGSCIFSTLLFKGSSIQIFKRGSFNQEGPSIAARTVCLKSNLVNFDIPKTLKTVLDSPKRALSNRTIGGPLSKNVPVTPLRYKFHDFLLLIY